MGKMKELFQENLEKNSYADMISDRFSHPFTGMLNLEDKLIAVHAPSVERLLELVYQRINKSESDVTLETVSFSAQEHTLLLRWTEIEEDELDVIPHEYLLTIFEPSESLF